MGDRAGWQEGAAAAGASLALAVLLTWPAARHPSALLVGHPGDDVWNHAWGYAWVAQVLAQGHLPLHTDQLAWPSGGALYFIDTFQAVLLAPLTWLFGAAVAYNTAMVGGIAGSAFGAWLLARRVSGSGGAAWIAAVIFGASPQLLAQASNGISETVAAGGLPFGLWALLRLLERPGPGRAAALALLAAAAALTSWYCGLFLALAGGVLLAWRALRAPAGLRAAGPWLGAAALGAALICLPPLLAFRGTLEASDALVTRDVAFVTASLTHHNLTDALAILRPGRIPSPDLEALFGEHLLIVVYLGWTGLLLAALGLGRREEAQPWPWIGLIFLLFSLGPYLYAGGDFVRLGGRRLPLPFLPLYEAVPLFSRVSHPFRFEMGVSLAVGALAACGVARLARTRRLALALPLSLLALLETALCSPTPIPVPVSDARVPAACAALAADPVPGAVLDLPMSLPNLERAVYLWYQTVHRRPVPWGLNEPMPASLRENRLTATLLRIEAGRADSLPARLPELDLAIAGRLLAREGLRAVVVHEDLFPPPKRSEVEALLGGLYGAPRRWGGEAVAVYLLDPAGSID